MWPAWTGQLSYLEEHDSFYLGDIVKLLILTHDSKRSSDELVFTSLNQIFLSDCEAEAVAENNFLTVVAPSYKNN